LPSTCITIYGIEIDSKQMVACLPSDKIQKIVSLLLLYKSKCSITLRELQSLHGLLNFACSVKKNKMQISHVHLLRLRKVL
jgi:hypothetical protein